MGGVGIYIKEIVAFNTISPFAIFYLSNLVSSTIISAELRKILEMGIKLINETEMGEDESPVVAVPPFALRKALPNLPGLDPAVYNQLTNKQKASRRVWHVEMESHHVSTFGRLVEICKEYNIFAYWGEHVRISEVVDQRSPQGDIDRVMKVAKRHTCFQCSMIVMQLNGIVDLDAVVKVPGENGEEGGELSLRYLLPRHYRTKDGESPLFAEVHQGQMLGSVEAVVPNAKSAEVVIVAMNKHMAGYLKHSLIDRGLDPEVVTKLVVASCCPDLVGKLDTVTWDSENQEIITSEDRTDGTRLEAFEKAKFYFDLENLRVSRQKKKPSYTAPEALFNLDETQSVTTLHAKNDAKRDAARRAAESDSEEEEQMDSASAQRELEQSHRGSALGIMGDGSNKSVTFSPLGSSDDQNLAARGATGGR